MLRPFSPQFLHSQWSFAHCRLLSLEKRMKRGGSGLTAEQPRNPEPPSHPPGQPERSCPQPQGRAWLLEWESSSLERSWGLTLGGASKISCLVPQQSRGCEEKGPTGNIEALGHRQCQLLRDTASCDGRGTGSIDSGETVEKRGKKIGQMGLKKQQNGAQSGQEVETGEERAAEPAQTPRRRLLCWQ